MLLSMAAYDTFLNPPFLGSRGFGGFFCGLGVCFFEGAPSALQQSSHSS